MMRLTEGSCLLPESVPRAFRISHDLLIRGVVHESVDFADPLLPGVILSSLRCQRPGAKIDEFYWRRL